MNHRKETIVFIALILSLVLSAGIVTYGGECDLDDYDKSDWIRSDQFFPPTLPEEESISSFFYVPGSTPPADRFVEVSGDHYKYATGGEVKFWGINIIGGGAFMGHQEAKKTAARLAKLGFNLVAFHQINNRLTGSENSYTLDSSSLDKLDYFIAELKEHGIYVILPLIEDYNFKEGDRVKDWRELNELPGFHGNRRRRAVGIFDDQSYNANNNSVVWIQKQYAKNLLDHRNPYTENRYANEPALLMVKINNEVSLLNRWKDSRLNDNDKDGSLTQYYSTELDEQWNNWLENRYGDQQGIEAAWGPSCLDGETLGNISRPTYEDRADYCRARLKDLGRFYMDSHKEYFDEMKDAIRGQVTARPSRMPVAGLNNFYGMSDKLATYEGLSVMTQNVTWEHPPFWDEFHFLNTAMVNMNSTSGTCSYPKQWPCFGHWVETKNTIFRATLASAFSNSPFMVTEYSYHFPKEYVAEYPLIGAAYGSFQDWNGIITHAYKGGEPGEFGDEYIHSRFNLFNNPVVMTQMPVASRMFRQGYVSEADQVYEVSYEEEGSLDMFLDFGRGDANNLYKYLSEKGIDYYSTLVHGIRNTVDGNTDADGSNPSNPFTSDTGELSWDMREGVVSVNSDEVEAAIGFLQGNESFFSDRLDHLTVNSSSDFATVSAASLDGQPLSSSNRILLNASSRLSNSGMSLSASKYNSCSCKLDSWGGPPLLMQPVRAEVTLTLPDARDIDVYRLTGEGKADWDHPGIEVSRDGSQFTFSIGKNGRDDDTLWYGIKVRRSEASTNLPKGWSMFSPPGKPDNPDPKVSLGDDISHLNLNLWYNYSSPGGYDFYPDDSTELTWQESYWVNLDQEVKVDMRVTTPGEDESLKFTSKGWKMVGFPYKVDWSKTTFTDPEDFSNDLAKHVRLVDWNSEQEKYFNYYSDTQHILPPWGGYWVKVRRASSADPARIFLAKTDKPPTSLEPSKHLPQSVKPKKLDYPPLPTEVDELRSRASPNPATGTSGVTFTVQNPRVEEIRVSVWEPTGKKVHASGYLSKQTVSWNLETDDGRKVPNGLYLYRIAARTKSGEVIEGEVKKLLILN